MTGQEVLQKLTDKQNGFGISTATIGRYSDYNRTTISHYLSGDREMRQRQDDAVRAGLRRYIEDLQEFYNTEVI